VNTTKGMMGTCEYAGWRKSILALRKILPTELVLAVANKKGIRFPRKAAEEFLRFIDDNSQEVEMKYGKLCKDEYYA
jgi:hypothetical protein